MFWSACWKSAGPPVFLPDLNADRSPRDDEPANDDDLYSISIWSLATSTGPYLPKASAVPSPRRRVFSAEETRLGDFLKSVFMLVTWRELYLIGLIGGDASPEVWLF